MHFTTNIPISYLPVVCIKECSAAGNVTAKLIEWQKKLDFTVSREFAVQKLGHIYENMQDDSDEKINLRALWHACIHFSQYLEGNPALGTDVYE